MDDHRGNVRDLEKRLITLVTHFATTGDNETVKVYVLDKELAY